MGHAHRRIDQPIESPHGQNFVVRVSRILHNGRTKTVHRQRERSALRAEQSSRHPPKPATQPQRKQRKRNPQQVLHKPQFVARLPGCPIQAAIRILPVLRLAKVVDAQQHNPLRGQRKSRQPIRRRAIAIQIAAGRKVALQHRRSFPHLAPAVRIAIVVRIERLMADRPQTLAKQHQQQQSGNPLCPPNIKPAQFHSVLSVPNRG